MTAAMTLWNFYFQIFDKTIAKEQVVEFLANLVQQIAGPMLIIWDRLPAHRSRLVAEFVEFPDGQIVLEYLPPYAPERNPVEYLVFQGCPAGCAPHDPQATRLAKTGL